MLSLKTDLIETVNNISNNNDDNDYVCDINNNIDDTHDKEDILKLKNIPKINRITRKKTYKFFRMLSATGPLGCRQVICSIRLARLSFLETNSSIGFLPLTPCYIQTF